MNRQQEHDTRKKLKILNYAEVSGNVSHTCRYCWEAVRGKFKTKNLTQKFLSDQINAVSDGSSNFRAAQRML